MNYLKTLKNHNKISYCTYSPRDYVQTVSDFTLRYAFGGDEECHIGHRKLLIYPGSFLKLNKGTQYWSTNNSITPVQIFSLSLDQHFVTDFCKSRDLTDRQLLDDKIYHISTDGLSETLYPFAGDMKFTVSHLKANLESGLNNEMLINEYLHHCLLNYYGLYQQQIYEKAERLHFLNKSTRVEILRRLNLAKEYLYSNYDQSITLDDISAYSCLSVNHLLRTFKQAFNTSPHQFLTEIRLKRAKQLLKTTDHAVNDIVSLVGFECPCSFSKLFKKRYDITPLHYRHSA